MIRNIVCTDNGCVLQDKMASEQKSGLINESDDYVLPVSNYRKRKVIKKRKPAMRGGSKTKRKITKKKTTSGRIKKQYRKPNKKVIKRKVTKRTRKP